MRNSLRLLQEGRQVLQELKKRTAGVELTAEQAKALEKYSDLMQLKLGLNYYDEKEPSLDFILLRKKYHDLELTKIDEAINEELNEINIIFEGTSIG